MYNFTLNKYSRFIVNLFSLGVSVAGNGGTQPSAKIKSNIIKTYPPFDFRLYILLTETLGDQSGKNVNFSRFESQE